MMRLKRKLRTEFSNAGDTVDDRNTRRMRYGIEYVGELLRLKTEADCFEIAYEFIRNVAWKLKLFDLVVYFNKTIIHMQIKMKSSLVMKAVRAHVLKHEWKLVFDDYLYDLSQSKDLEEK